MCGWERVGAFFTTVLIVEDGGDADAMGAKNVNAEVVADGDAVGGGNVGPFLVTEQS